MTCRMLPKWMLPKKSSQNSTSVPYRMEPNPPIHNISSPDMNENGSQQEKVPGGMPPEFSIPNFSPYNYAADTNATDA